MWHVCRFVFAHAHSTEFKAPASSRSLPSATDIVVDTMPRCILQLPGDLPGALFMFDLQP